MNIKKRAVGLAATVGLVGGLFAMGAPAAHAVTIGGCGGVQFVGTLTPPLAGSGAATATTASTKTAKAGLRAWGVGFSFLETATGAGTCTIGANTFTDVTVGGKLSGVASCDSASVDPTLYPLNGKLKLTYAAKTLSSQAYVRIAGFDPVPGPDVIAITGIVIKGGGVGATVGGEVFFDPVVIAVSNDDPVAIAEGATPGTVLKKDYFFDNAQVVVPCGSTPSAPSVATVWGGDGLSLLGSVASGLTFDF